MPDRRHVLSATDRVLRAFCISEGVLETDHIFTFKGVDETVLPFLVCASLSAERLRAKNWKVTGTLSLLTSSSATATDTTTDPKDASEQQETDLLEAFEQYVPTDDSPQQLAAAIMAAALADPSPPIAATEYLMTSFYLNKCERDVTESGNWQFQIDFTASVIA